MQEWLLAHDPVAAARQTPAEFERSLVVPGNPMRRPESRRAYDLWRTALTGEHRAAGWLGERQGYAEFARGRLRPAGETAPAASVSCDGTPALRAGRPRDNAPVVLHLHGGGYAMGSAELSAPLAGRLAEAAGGWSLVPDYRLAPEHPFPAALHDVLAAYRWLARQYPRAPILVSGECAGGGLALSLALALRDAARDGDGPAIRMPAGLHVVSPFCDLALSAEQLTTAAGTDPWFNRIALIQLAACYIHDTDPGHALVSPSRADLSGLPPLLIQAAEPEALFPSAERLASRARGAGVPVTFSPVADSVHSFILFDFLPEADRALAEFAAFARTLLTPRTGRDR